MLANEQVIDGRCERCGAEVEARNLEQWMFKITDYADRLLDDMALLESWPERVLTMQRNWIGRSEGGEILFRIEELDEDVPVFTTRPDTLFGATFFVLAPEHPLVEQFAERAANGDELRAYARHAAADEGRGASRERGEDRRLHGLLRRQPVNDERIPIWVADYVLMDYGTGAIMAVPAHDERDFAFAQKFGLPIVQVVAPADAVEVAEVEEGAAYVEHSENEVLVNSGEFTGMPAPDGEARDRRVARRARAAAARPSTTACATGCSRASATGAARSRSSTATGCGIVPVPEDELPVLLPEIDDFLPKGRSPLAAAEDWVRVDVPARAAARPGARPTRWTRSSTRRGTSCATPTRATTRSRSTAGWSTTGCRSTSTSAGSSTRSCT